MREILFRGKRVFDGKWVNGFAYKQYSAAKVETWYIRAFETDFLVIPETVCQYTGLTDKRSTKIFEGDIVKFYNGDGEYSPYEVRWQDSGFSVLMNGNPDLFDELDDFFSRRCEIIGNIYDNPELMKGGIENG